jgi:hypothetical protein
MPSMQLRFSTVQAVEGPWDMLAMAACLPSTTVTEAGATRTTTGQSQAGWIEERHLQAR